jgi:hypothetical protein
MSSRNEVADGNSGILSSNNSESMIEIGLKRNKLYSYIV